MKAKKLIALGLVLAMMLTIVAGCGGKATESAKKPTEILIGANFELTGNVATYGVSVMNAVQMAFDEINAQGGVLGLQLKVVKADNKSDLAESANVATKLITQDKVIAMIGPVTSTNALAAASVATQNKIPLLTPTGTAEKITFENGQTKDWVFRSCFIDAFQGEVGGNFASKTLKAKTAALLVEQSSDYSKGLAAVFEKTFKANGGTIVATEAFVTDDKDFRSQLTKINGTKPDVLYVPSYYEQDGLIAKQAREVGYKGPIVGADGWDSAKLLEIAGGADVLQGIYFSNHYSVADTSPNVAKFVQAYKTKFGSEPDALAALGYDGAYLLADAIKRAGAADPAKIKDALAATKGFVGVTGSVTMDNKHDPIKSAVVLSFDQAGKLKFVETIKP